MAMHIRYKMAFVAWLNSFRKEKEELHTFASANEHAIVLLLEKNELPEDGSLSDEAKAEVFEFIQRYWVNDPAIWIKTGPPVASMITSRSRFRHL